MVDLRVREIKVVGVQLKGLRKSIENVKEAIDRFKREGVGVTYDVILNGKPGMISGRIDDLPDSVLEHALVPNSFTQATVRLEDMKIGKKIIEDNSLAGNFRLVEESPIDWPNLPFQLNPSRAMFFAKIKKDASWEKEIVSIENQIYPFASFSVHPASLVFHYGQAGFEGLKAFRTMAGNLVGFRWEENAKRLIRTVERLAMTPASVDFYLKAIVATVLHNEDFIPPPGLKAALYVRPFQMGIGQELGVRPSPEEALLVFVSPVGPYFKSGFEPINLLVEEKYHRAAPGGTGNVKAAGNYAVGMLPSHLAKKDKNNKYNEILWLDCEHNKFVEEVGAANFFCLKNGILYTPELSGTILPGITRDSVMRLARAFGLEVIEGKVSIDFALKADEVFCTGTAAVISPIGSITYKGERYEFSKGAAGETTLKLYDALTSLQEERFDDASLKNMDPQVLNKFKQEWIFDIRKVAEKYFG